jgi:prevent-host-death family protein
MNRTVMGAVFLIGAMIAPLGAQAYPHKPLRLIVPFPGGGGGADYVGRVVGQKLAERLGQGRQGIQSERRVAATTGVRSNLRYTGNWLTSSREPHMKTVGAFQAKTQLSQLLDQVEKGETVTITRHGRPVAVLAPVAPARPAKTGKEWLAEVKRLRKGITLGGTVTIRQLIDEGRRY